MHKIFTFLLSGQAPRVSLVLKAKGEGYPPLSSGAVGTWLFRERLSALARKSLKRELGTQGRHQCVLWHRGDPAGWTRYKSLLVGAWFNSIGTGKIEDLRALLLRTLLSIVFKLAHAPHDNILGNAQDPDLFEYYDNIHLNNVRQLDRATDSFILKTFQDVNKRHGQIKNNALVAGQLVKTNKLVNRRAQWLISIKRDGQESTQRDANQDGFLESFLIFTQSIKRNQHLGRRKTLVIYTCLLYTSPSPRDRQKTRMPSSA